MRTRFILAAAAAALAAGASLAPIAVQGASAAQTAGGLRFARAANYSPYGEIQLLDAPSWCITQENPSTPGSALVLGVCAEAASQQFDAIEQSDDYFELTTWTGLCVTVPNANGAPDGKIAELGNCADDVSQIFGPGNGTEWVMPYEADNNGYNLAIDDKGYVLKAYNPIDTTYTCNSCRSEQWSGPPWITGG